MFRRRRTQSAADPPGHSAHAVSRLQPVEDVYLLFLNRPLHHPELPQPDAQRLFDCLTRHPARHPSALVFLSDLTAELASVGSSWSQVGIDYEAVTDRLVALHHRGQVPALRLAELSELAVTLLASGPQTQIYVGAPDGGPPELLDPAIFQARREELRTMIRADLDRTVASRRH
jgi:hypothetical protein